MRANEFELPKSNEDIIARTELVSYLENNCKPWLDKTNNGKLFVYRGTDKYAEHAFTKPIRKDRNPKDSSSGFTFFYEKLMDLADVPKNGARRNNSAFTTSRRAIANDYGSITYVFVPVGEFNFTWSPVMDDWYGILEEGIGFHFFKEHIFKDDIIDKVVKRIEKDGIPNPDKLDIEFWIGDNITDIPTEWLDRRKIKELISTDHLPEAIKSGNELMITADKGLYVPVEWYKSEVLKNL